ncbi:MAG TPA: hypothetical protein VF024_18825 [Solirubrobacteraceae bacterium]
MPAIDFHAPVLGPLGEPCAACGEPLAADQRYCLCAASAAGRRAWTRSRTRGERAAT